MRSPRRRPAKLPLGGVVLLALALAAGCGVLDVPMQLLRAPDACARHQEAVKRFDALAHTLLRSVGGADLVPAVLRIEPAMREAFELLPTSDDPARIPVGIYPAFGEYLLALEAAREGDADGARRHAHLFIQAVGVARSDARGCV
jgi:hypothetical protein